MALSIVWGVMVASGFGQFITAPLRWGRMFVAAWRGESAPRIVRAMVSCALAALFLVWCYAEYTNAGR